MAVNPRFFMSSLLKHRPSFNTIIHRCLSTKQPTLFETLNVIETSKDVFIQPAETLFVFPNRKNVFGGQIIGSAIYAAQKTLTKNYPLHSLHSYFLTASDNSSPISYTVSRLRDGKSFETRSVTARQDNRIVFECSMNFHRKEKGNLEHQLPMPTGIFFINLKYKHLFYLDAVPPENLLSLTDHIQKLLDDKRLLPELKPLVESILQMPMRIDVRHCHQRDLLQPKPVWPARDLVWIKSLDPLPDDPHIHRSAVAYSSDRVLLGSAWLPYAIHAHDPRIKMQASLDHSMWFHDDFSFDKADQDNSSEEKHLSKPIRRSSDIPPIPSRVLVRADDWLLYELECPIQMNNRAWTTGRIWTRNGRLVVTCAQEGVIRCY
jgi:acyl-CoA thioesterase II